MEEVAVVGRADDRGRRTGCVRCLLVYGHPALPLLRFNGLRHATVLEIAD